jgi:hypothetical protein
MVIDGDVQRSQPHLIDVINVGMSHEQLHTPQLVLFYQVHVKDIVAFFVVVVHVARSEGKIHTHIVHAILGSEDQGILVALRTDGLQVRAMVTK